jgi:hypothetical protein
MALSANGYAHPHLVTQAAQVTAGSSVYFAKPIGVGAALTGIPTAAQDPNIKRLHTPPPSNTAAASSTSPAAAVAVAMVTPAASDLKL